MLNDPKWEALSREDLMSVNELADRIHTALPERPEVFEEKLSIYPAGCRKLTDSGRCLGYAIAHPWTLLSIPPLDEFLRQLPRQPNCLYLHDIVVSPEARGRNAASAYLEYLGDLATRSGIHAIALVSVYGTDALWSRLGFQIVSDGEIERKLSTYGPTAKYMKLTLQ